MAEAAPPPLAGVPHVGQVALACALGYLDLRFEGGWRETHPRLVAWLDDFAAAVPSFEATRRTDRRRLRRYLAEFDSTTTCARRLVSRIRKRAGKTLGCIVGKRLLYRGALPA